ncbi:MAG: HNH endonuclease domain-containing protein [Bacteroidales bacterium]|nr:HNH endonuclease domain-containing protein [Bacteroidales bacterium]
MGKTLGLDIGTNSIACALTDVQNKKIEMACVRIIPMDAAILGNFEKGNQISQTKQRTQYRSMRRVRLRQLLRRARLHRVLQILGFLPEHYAKEIDFEKHPGCFLPEKEPKLAWREIAPKKFEFIFKTSFEEMLLDFQKNQPNLLKPKKNGEQALIPYDWTIYYLRKKALKHPISKEELSWILLNFNQKRGYYQLRDEKEKEENQHEEFCPLKVESVEATDEKRGKDTWYNVYLENGCIYRMPSSQPLDWTGKIKEFIVTTKTGKNGESKRSLRIPGENDWTLVKKRTEADINKSGKEVGEFIYDTLLNTPNQKIRGNLISVIERKFYEQELSRILHKQKDFHPELCSKDLLNDCLAELYKNNEGHKTNLKKKDICYLLLHDIIFYQRPLKRKKSLIANCPYEERHYVDKDTGEIKNIPLKVIPKSHPLFQEFRLWQFVLNLKIYKKGDTADRDEEVTSLFIKDYADIFSWLNDKEKIDQKGFFSYEGFNLKHNEREKYRWNYVDKAYVCNETRSLMLNRLLKHNLPTVFLNESAAETALWHILYSVKDSKELESALGKFSRKYKLERKAFIAAFGKCKSFAYDYGAYSEKAIKKLLSVMRTGKYWCETSICTDVRKRIDKIISKDFDVDIDERTQAKCLDLKEIKDFRGLPSWLACYVIYGRHSEAKEITKWNSPKDIDIYLKSFRQHSLRNPIVEQVVMETLRVVRDIWEKYGSINEIHVELGREMKLPANERKRLSEEIAKNEETNIRIRRLLEEFTNAEYRIEGVRPYSPNQQNLLKIYEDEALKGTIEVPKDIGVTINKFRETDEKKRPSKAEIMRYKLWLEQQYRSPYTGEIIPLGKLFTPAYEIEHIIPQSRFFDDSQSNKVICESAVNKLKDNKTGYEFIKCHHGEKVSLPNGETVTIFEEEAYKSFVEERYCRNRKKKNKLLMEDIPKDFNQRQLNDTRYISRLIKGLLSNIVREPGETEAESKHVISCTGAITNILKQEWGMNDVWNDLIYHRFERLNEKTESLQFGEWTNKGGKRVFQTQIPAEFERGFNKKRIDHRNHALDAIILACMTRNHINYLNNNSGKSDNTISRYDLQHTLCYKTKPDENGHYQWRFHKPWATFTQDVKMTLESITVSFKQNLRVINKATNRSLRYDEKGKKVFLPQQGENLAIRKPLHVPMPYGKRIYDFEIMKICENVGMRSMISDSYIRSKVEEAFTAHDKNITKTRNFLKSNPVRDKEGNIVNETAFKIRTEKFRKRQPISRLSDRGPSGIKTSEKAVQFINKIADNRLRTDLLSHLRKNGNNIDLAFSADGIERFNSNRKKPVFKLPIAENGEKRFPLGERHNTKHKWVEAEKGTNLFFAIYRDQGGKRSFDTIPLNVVIERMKQRLPPAPDRDEKGNLLLYVLSPNDLVYVPTAEQNNRRLSVTDIEKERIYKMVSCTGTTCDFIPAHISYPIMNSVELGSNNKAQKSWTGEMIKEVCIPIKVDRLGNIIKIYND